MDTRVIIDSLCKHPDLDFLPGVMARSGTGIEIMALANTL